jgi:hypothetical protein
MTIQQCPFILKVATAVAALSISGAGMALAPQFMPFAIEASAQHAGGGGHDSGTTHDDSSQHATDSGQRKGQVTKPGEAAGQGRKSMEDIFRDIGTAEEEDSDRPIWAGGGGGPNDRGGKPGDAGSARGDLYGDLYVILRDEDGNPILSEAGFVQPIDAAGNLIPLDAEGAPIDLTLVQEVELGRLNVGRSPTSVLDRRAQEVVILLQTATAISFDESGRLVLTVDGVTKTIDSPLENLALYVALMTSGTIPGVTDLPGTEYDYLVDGQFTTADLEAAAGLLAAASDKYASLEPDTIAYINAILGINTVTTGDVTYSSMDYSDYTYDRSDTYDNVMVTVLIKQADGSYLPTQVDLYDAVFGGEDYSESGTFEAFATAVDDSRAVLAYIHDNEAPE